MENLNVKVNGNDNSTYESPAGNTQIEQDENDFSKWAAETRINLRLSCYSRTKTLMNKLKTELNNEGFTVSEGYRICEKWQQTVVIQIPKSQHDETVDKLVKILDRNDCSHGLLTRFKDNGENKLLFLNRFLSSQLESNERQFKQLQEEGLVTHFQHVSFYIELESREIDNDLKEKLELQLMTLKIFKKCVFDICEGGMHIYMNRFRFTLDNINLITETMIKFYANHGINDFRWDTAEWYFE